MLIALLILGIVGSIGSAVNKSNPDWDATSVAVIILVVCGVIYGIYRFVSGGGGGGGSASSINYPAWYAQNRGGNNADNGNMNEQRRSATYGYPRK